MQHLTICLRIALTPAFFLLVFSAIEAQIPDPSLRLRGEGADSITGGMPSVMVRKVTDDDRLEEHRHAIEIDPIKSAYHFNIAYHYTLNHYLTIGGGIDFTPGILGSNDEYSGFGAAANAKFFFSGDAPNGAYFRSGIMHFSGSQLPNEENLGIVKDVIMSSVQFDFGLRVAYDNWVYDAMIGYERFLSDSTSTPVSDPSFLKLSSTAVNMIHMALAIGISF
ncbi:MAG: hypothetical protein AB7H80_06415 [Candidatus Kapaibacterium sp.]